MRWSALAIFFIHYWHSLWQKKLNKAVEQSIHPMNLVMRLCVSMSKAFARTRHYLYGQADVPLNIEAFDADFFDIKNKLQGNVDVIYSSPLIRCSYLANELIKAKYPDKKLITDNPSSIIYDCI